MLSAIIDLGNFLDLLLGSIVITISWNKDPALFVVITLTLLININLFLVKIRSRKELLASGHHARVLATVRCNSSASCEPSV